jgi:serine protease AprX
MASHKSDDEYVTKSGTSFAAPMLSGLAGLLWESGRRTYGEGWTFRWTEARQFAPYYSTKPVDAPVKKDNAYGFGLPAMGSMLGQMSQVESPLSDTMDAFPMLMMLGMMGMLVRGVA